VTQPKTTLQNRNSGQEVAKIQAADPVRRSAAKTHRDYWKERLIRHSYTHQGKLIEVNEWSIRIQHLGKRRSFALGTNNKDAAAIKARDIYLSVVAKGWEATEEKFNPGMVVRRDDPTLGDFLEEVRTKSTLKPKVFRNYSGYFRRIVADIFSIEEGKARFSYRDGSRAAWLEKVHAIQLAKITPEIIQDWRTKYIKRTEQNPLARQSAIRSANSYIRCARSLFSKKWLSQLKVRLPSQLPFEGVKVERNRAPRYNSTIDPKKLIEAAKTELSSSDPQAYMVFMLALGAGLRKAEIDGLEWSHINFDKGSILVEPTVFRDVKTESSEADVQVDSTLMQELDQHKKNSKSRFVIESSGVSRPGLDRQHYRADEVFKKLYLWLRNQGVKSDKPLHTLRKEFGSLINLHFGLYAAMTALRHADIKTTAGHYADNKQRIALPLEKILEESDRKP
jgi:integrase